MVTLGEIREAVSASPRDAPRGRLRPQVLAVERLGVLLHVANTPAFEEDPLRILCEKGVMDNAMEGLRAHFTTDPVNFTEGKMACHPLLRGHHGDYTREIFDRCCAMRERALDLAEEVRGGGLKMSTGKPVRTVLHLGTGGSHWPVRLLKEAFGRRVDGPRSMFVTSSDPLALDLAMRSLDPETTAVVVSSKSFRTRETLGNAAAARARLSEALGRDASANFIGVTACPEEAERFGIPRDRILEMPDWVGGRFSACSAASITAMIAAGRKPFEEMLLGAHEMDRHVANAEADRNLAIMLTASRWLMHDMIGWTNRCVLAYAHALRSWVPFCQQLTMESAGKMPIFAKPLSRPGGEIVWGGEGPACEHSIMQHLMQADPQTSIEMIAFAREEGMPEDSRLDVLAHFLGQREALDWGLSEAEARDILHRKGMEEIPDDLVLPSLVADIGYPVTSLIFDELSPRSIGMLLALEENAVVARCALNGVNAFDQWGVEAGKELTARMRERLGAPSEAALKERVRAILDERRQKADPS